MAEALIAAAEEAASRLPETAAGTSRLEQYTGDPVSLGAALPRGLGAARARGGRAARPQPCEDSVDLGHVSHHPQV
jgi:hypothetical protein